MNTSFDRHVPEQVLEEYAMGMLSEKDCMPLEEHLLICSACQDLLAQTDEYIRVAKAAAALSAAEARAGNLMVVAGADHSP
jgi:Putative zinc-finger